jgi:hypothetical protein
MQEVDGAVVLVNLDTGNYYGLEMTARRIWQLLDTPRSLAKICATLEQEFQVSVALCEKHVLEFADQLLHAGAIELSAGQVSENLRP